MLDFREEAMKEIDLDAVKVINKHIEKQRKTEQKNPEGT